MTDSAGVPWKGRSFEKSEPSTDDGSAPQKLIEAIRRFRAGELSEADVVDELRDSRLLIPLVAELGAAGTEVTDTGLRSEKSQELAIVTVAGPDGRTVLPAFTSVAAMAQWNPSARPIPASASRVALAAASENTEIVVVDPTNDTEFVIRRPALRAIARSLPWLPSYLDTQVLAEFMAAAAPEPAVVAVQLAPGDPGARLAGPELIVHLTLAAGLDRGALDAVIARLRARWSASALIADRVDSLTLQLAGVA